MGRRSIVLLLIAQAAGILWADRGGGPGVAWGAIAVVAGLALRRRRSGLLLGLATGAFLLGHQALSQTLERARADALRGAQLEPQQIRLVDARVAARRSTAFGEEVELIDARSRAGDARIPERLVLALAPGAYRAERLLWPGARVRVGVFVSPLRPARNPGSPDRAHALARRGFTARARLVKPDWVVERIDANRFGARLAVRLARLRRDGLERVRLRLDAIGRAGEPVAGAGLVRALALGDRRALPEETRHAFQRLGLAHLVSVSGLHVGFVAVPAAWAIARVRAWGRRRTRPVRGFAAPFAAGCGAALAYAWLAGAGIPAQRACLLFALFGLVRAARGKLAPAPALAAVALVLLAADPASLFDLGALFSFGACAALIAGGVWGGRSGAPGLDPLRGSLAISIGLLPLVEAAGLPRALPAPLVNALAIPWTGFVVMPCALAASVLAGGLPEGRGDPVLALLLWPAAALEQAARALAAALPAVWLGDTGPGRLPWSAALVIGAIAFARLRAGDWVSGAAAWLALGLFGLSPLRGPAFLDPRPRVVFLDVGQADAALVEARASTWLIDTGAGPETGGGGSTVLRALRAQGVERLDVLVVTHGDLDHRGGALRILSAVEVGELWLPAAAAVDPSLEGLAEAARERSVPVRWVAAGDGAEGVAGPGDIARERPAAADRPRVEVLWPPAPPRAGPSGAVIGTGSDRPGRGTARNEASLVLRLTLDGHRFLFAADIGEASERRLLELGAPLRAEVLKVAHHGSRGSSGAAFLAAVAPRIAIVSAPCGAGRGLPSAQALARLEAAGAALGWTGRDGAIAVVAGRVGGGAAAAAPERAAPLQMRYWGSERRCVPDRRRSDPGREGG